MADSYWLVKQEPEAYSWTKFVEEGGTDWTGVRSFPARLHLRSMKKGDLVFFYHSVSEKSVVGIAEVTRAAFPDPTAEEGDWSAVSLAPVKALKRPVSLEEVKADKLLRRLPLVTQGRLSVMPLTAEQFGRISQLGETVV